MKTNKNLLLLLFFTLSFFPLAAQKRDTLVYFFDVQLQRVRNRSDAAYGGLMIRQQPDQWVLYIFYPNKKTMFIGNYEDKKMKVRNGMLVTFYENGLRSKYAVFKYNVLNGENESWYENGQLQDSGSYDNGLKNGEWKSWYQNGQLESAGNYYKGAMEDTWRWYRENGLPATKEVYRNDSLQDLACYNAAGKPDGVSCGISVPPIFPGGEDSLNAFIIDNLYYPDEAVKEHIEGDVSFEFCVKKDGKIGDIKFESSPSPLLSDEVKRMLLSMPAWQPAISHNRPVDYYENMTLPFYLNN